jgi:hypothetical protein
MWRERRCLAPSYPRNRPAVEQYPKDRVIYIRQAISAAAARGLAANYGNGFHLLAGTHICFFQLVVWFHGLTPDELNACGSIGRVIVFLAQNSCRFARDPTSLEGIPHGACMSSWNFSRHEGG